MMFLIDPFRFGAAAPSFSVWDPATAGTGVTLSNGDATATATASDRGIGGTQGRTIGTAPWSFTVTVGGPDNQHLVGIGNSSALTGFYPGKNSQGFAYYGPAGNKYTNDAGSAYGASFTAGDVIGVVLASNGEVTFYKNGSSQGVAFNLTSLGFSSSMLWYPMWGAGTSAAGARTGTIDTSAVLGGATAWG